MNATLTTSLQTVERYARLLWRPGDVRELRILGGPTQVGYFDDPAALAQAAGSWDGKLNLYLTINPVDPTLLARAVNRVKRSREATADKDILARKFLPIDIDPIRPSGISATDDEVAAALDTARSVAGYLDDQGWGPPITSLSGNGHQLLYPIDLPNDQASTALVAGVLSRLAARFDDDQVKVDTSVSNAARIMALIGTMKVKGDATPERPHRRSALIHVPDELEPVPAERLAALVSPTNEQRPKVSVGTGARLPSGWVRRWLDAAGIEYEVKAPDAAGVEWYGLASCPWHPDDGTPFECGVGEAPDGKGAAHCFHDRGVGKGWHEFRAELSLGPESMSHDRTHLRHDGEDGHGDAGELVVLPSPKLPMQVAARLVADRYSHPDGGALVQHWQGSFWEWLGPHWSELDDDALKAATYRFTEGAVWLKDGLPEPWAPNRYKIADLIDALKASVHIPSTVTMPSWSAVVRNERRSLRADTIVSCSNGLLHVPMRTLSPHDPGYFNGVSVPFPFEPDAAPPTAWLRFLDQLWPDDPEAIDALGEFFGYIISERLDLHKILLIIGPTRGGKGVIARILKALVGHGNSAGPTLSSLGQNFGLQPLIGKPLAIISDARLGGSATNVVVERLLSISGEDMLTIDRKYKTPWTGTLPTRFLVISNELPRFGDASGAITNRFIVLNLTRSWLGKEDSALTTKLLPELPGILGWALEGLERLRQRGYMSEPHSSTEAKLALADLVSPVSAFTRDRCIVGSGHQVHCDELYKQWKTWAEDNGHRAGSTHVFGRNLRAVVPGLRTIRPRDGDARERWYQGLCLGHQGADHCGPLRTTDADELMDDDLVRNGPQHSPSLVHAADDRAPVTSSSDLRAEAATLFKDEGFEWAPPPPDDDRGAIADAEEEPWA